MSNCTFTGNNIDINVGAWVNSGAFGTDCYGVGFWGGYLSGALNSLHINGNTFTFSNLAGSRTWDGATNAIRLVTDGSLPTLSDLQIKNNTINNSVGAGMNINLPVNGLTVTGNTITDPGSSPNSIAANSKSAVLIQNNVQNGTIQSNYIIDNYSSAKMQYGIWEGTDNLGNDIYGGNSVQIASGATVPEFFSEYSHQGPAWT